MVDESTPESEEPGDEPEAAPPEGAEPVAGGDEVGGETSEPAAEAEAPAIDIDDTGSASKLQAESRALREEAEKLHEHAEARQRAAAELREEAARLREEAEKLLAQPEELAAEVARLREQTEAAAALFAASSEADGQPEPGAETEAHESEEWVEEPGQRQPFATPSGPPPGDAGDTEEQAAVRRRSWLRRR